MGGFERPGLEIFLDPISWYRVYNIDMMKAKMNKGSECTIGMLAGRAGVDIQTVHYYERRGLLLPVGRTGAGYRLYNEGSLKSLLFIRRAKEMGFTLEEIKGFLDLSVEDVDSCDSVKEKALAKLRDVEEKITALGSLRTVLNELVESCDRRSPTEACPVLKSIEVDLPVNGGKKK